MPHLRSLNPSELFCYTPPLVHHHDFFELFYVLEGNCHHRVGQSDTRLRSGDCCLIQPGVAHAIDVSDESIVIDILIRKSTFRAHFFDVLRGLILDIYLEFYNREKYHGELINAQLTAFFARLLRSYEGACELLRDTNLPVGEIGYQVGYMNQEHFIRVFKRRMGATPGAYRRNGGHE
jgi:AraC-like DNA-binding protein